MINADLPLPVWVWHPDRLGKLKTRLHCEFELSEKIEEPTLGIALTGGARVLIDGVEILDLPEDPENVCRFYYTNSARLEIGNHQIEIHMECQKPMPEHGAISFAYDRRVGCIAWLEGSGFRLVTDENWEADDTAAVEICKLGQEPYGDLDCSPADFIRSGFGDLLTGRIPITVTKAENVTCQSQGSLVSLSGKIESSAVVEPLKHSELVSIYHLRKQDDWKRLRKDQYETDLSGTPNVLMDLELESNARLGVHNLGSEPVTILWNGAESILELEHYDGCITEVVQVEPGKTAYSVPAGMRYMAAFVLGKPGTEFELDVICESVGTDPGLMGAFQCDDEQINEIYRTSVRTSRLCHQLSLWDGIKRDRLPWVYDLYLAARGAYPIWSDFSVLKRSLMELGHTPEGSWMNTLPDYTLWWFATIWEYLMHRSDAQFAEELAPAIQRHADWVGQNIDENGFMKVERGFIDWVPMTPEESRLSLQAVYVIAREALRNISDSMPHLEITFDWPVPEIPEEQFLNAEPVATKVLGILSGYVSEESALEFLTNYELSDPITPCSGYLLACLYADSDMHEKGLSVIRSLWGGMLDSGATAFWEAARCDYPDDFHKHLTTYTAYDEYRISLCHAWSSTPVEWFTRVLLGVNPLVPGYREVEIVIWAPESMKECAGQVSTPFGPIGISWIRDEDGQILVRTDIPEGVRVV